MHIDRTEALTAHVEHLFRGDSEFRQIGVVLPMKTDFLIDRTRYGDQHRFHLRMDDGRQAYVWYKRDSKRQLVIVRTDETTYPEVSNEDMPSLVAGILRDLIDGQPLPNKPLDLPADGLDGQPIQPVSQA